MKCYVGDTQSILVFPGVINEVSLPGQSSSQKQTTDNIQIIRIIQQKSTTRPLKVKREVTEVSALPFTNQQISMISSSLSKKMERQEQLAKDYKWRVQQIFDGKSAYTVYSSLYEILQMNANRPAAIQEMGEVNTDIPDINIIFNQALSNIMKLGDFPRLVKAAEQAEQFDIVIHPKMKHTLSQIAAGHRPRI